MPGLDGLDLARVLARFKAPPPVVFVTAYEEHAVEAFDLRAVDYLLKPVRAERLAEAVRRVGEGGDRDPGAGRDDEQIPVELGGVTRFVHRRDVHPRRGAGRLRPAAHRRRAPTWSGCRSPPSRSSGPAPASSASTAPSWSRCATSTRCGWSPAGAPSRSARDALRGVAAGTPASCATCWCGGPGRGSSRDRPARRRRVRVTGPRAARRQQPRPGTGDIDEQTALGDVYMQPAPRAAAAGRRHPRAALRSRRRPAAGCSPLPRAADGAASSGCRCPGCCSACSSTPLLVARRRLYVRQAERNERDFGSAPGAGGDVSVTTYGVAGLVALVVSASRRWRSAPTGCGSRAPPATSTSPRASVRPGSTPPRSAASTSRPRRSSASPGWSLTAGAHMLWYPVGWTAGYLVLLVLVAAPLRRCGAYTLPDFAEARLGHAGSARLCSVLVVAIGWLYLLPQFQGAGLTLTLAIDARDGSARSWSASSSWSTSPAAACAASPSCRPSSTGSSSPRCSSRPWSLLVIWAGDGRPDTGGGGRRLVDAARRGQPGPLHDVLDHAGAPSSAPWGCRTWSCASTPTPTAGPPAARRSSVLGPARRLLPAAAGLRRARPAPTALTADDTVVLELPRLMLVGLGRRPADRAGDRRRVRGVPLDVVRPGHRRSPACCPGRAAAADRASRLPARRHVAVGVPLVAVARCAPDLSVARAVGLAFAVAASSFCPLLVLGIWWRGLTAAGAAAGLLGAAGSAPAPAWSATLYDGAPEAGASRCSASRPPGACRSRSPSMVGVSLADPRPAVPATRAGSWSGCTPRRSVPLDRG